MLPVSTQPGRVTLATQTCMQRVCLQLNSLYASQHTCYVDALDTGVVESFWTNCVYESQ